MSFCPFTGFESERTNTHHAFVWKRLAAKVKHMRIRVRGRQLVRLFRMSFAHLSGLNRLRQPTTFGLQGVTVGRRDDVSETARVTTYP